MPQSRHGVVNVGITNGVSPLPFFFFSFGTHHRTLHTLCSCYSVFMHHRPATFQRTSAFRRPRFAHSPTRFMSWNKATENRLTHSLFHVIPFQRSCYDSHGGNQLDSCEEKKHSSPRSAYLSKDKDSEHRFRIQQLIASSARKELAFSINSASMTTLAVDCQASAWQTLFGKLVETGTGWTLQSDPAGCLILNSRHSRVSFGG